MKRLLCWLLMAVLIMLTVVFNGAYGLGFLSVPLCIIALVVFSSYISGEHLLYMALFFGIILDSQSAVIFGFHIAFLFCTVLLCSYVLKLQSRDQNSFTTLAICLLLTVFYNFFTTVPVLSAENIVNVTTFATQIAWQLVMVSIWVFILQAVVAKLWKSKYHFSVPLLMRKGR